MRSIDRPLSTSASYAHILVAVDTSSAAENAVRLALALVHGNPRAMVTFCHVLDVPRMVARTVRCAGDYAAEFKAAREAARATLEPFRALARQRGIVAQKCVRYGNPAAEIASFAELVRADLIVIGNRRTTKLQRLLCGSTRDHLIRKSRLPVLIADGEQFRAVRFRPRCILMTGAADRADGDGAKRVARSFAQTFAARLISSSWSGAGTQAQMTALDVAVRDYRPGLIVVPRPRRQPIRDLFGIDPIERILRNNHIPVMVTDGASAGARV
jgi:nucleotide-binding universal stress UspA family protein